MVWVKSDVKSFSQFRQEVSSMVSVKNRALAWFQMWYTLRFAGDWKKDSAVAKFWGFLVANVTGSLWQFCVFKLISKLYAALVVNFAKGLSGGIMMTAFLALEGLIVAWSKPNRDHWQNIVGPCSIFCNRLSSAGKFIHDFVAFAATYR